MKTGPAFSTLNSTETSRESSLSFRLADFWAMPPAQRLEILLQAIESSHAWHFQHNRAYRQTITARGVGSEKPPSDLSRLLRPTAQTFKSYIDLLGTPFPDQQPRRFLSWLADQLSVEIPRQRFNRFRSRYTSQEALLQDIERIYADFGFEILTSSGTSGRSSIIVRDQDAIQRTVESFYLSFQRYFGMQVDHRAIFIMPRQARIAMARMASFSLRRVGIPIERSHFTIPFSASPDQVRVRAGRTFRPGWRGWIESRILHPFMNWMNDYYVTRRAVLQTLTRLRTAQADGEKALLFGSWVHLHAIALELRARDEVLQLASGSVLGTGGGFKERYSADANQIRKDLAETFQTIAGEPIPLHDTYGMAEGNWAAMQCRHRAYHIPPWVLAFTLDEDDRVQTTADSVGMLAFFDPLGGGELFPAFFKTSDRVRLVNSLLSYQPSMNCPCGEIGAYIAENSIQRVDLLGEAGCAAQM
jgi:hypothetical protein